MKYFVLVLLVCGLVAFALAANAHPAQARKHNEKASPAERKAEERGKAANGSEDSQLSRVLNKWAEVATAGSNLGIDAAQRILTGQQSRSGDSFHNRAIQLADDTITAARMTTPIIARAIGEYAPKALETVRAIASSIFV